MGWPVLAATSQGALACVLETGQALRALAATQTTPMVMTVGYHPVAEGFITSFARPGGSARFFACRAYALGETRSAARRDACGPGHEDARATRNEASLASRRQPTPRPASSRMSGANRAASPRWGGSGSFPVSSRPCTNSKPKGCTRNPARTDAEARQRDGCRLEREHPHCACPGRPLSHLRFGVHASLSHESEPLFDAG